MSNGTNDKCFVCGKKIVMKTRLYGVAIIVINNLLMKRNVNTTKNIVKQITVIKTKIMKKMRMHIMNTKMIINVLNVVENQITLTLVMFQKL
jgi:hypothetical protein